MSDAKKKKKSKKRKHADLVGDDHEISLDLEEANDTMHTESQRKKKKKSKRQEQGPSSHTLLISEDGDSTKYPLKPAAYGEENAQQSGMNVILLSKILTVCG